ncbi:MAG: carotenoid biosynthesis protein [Cyclobacteriaceae bacterium]
MGFLVGNMKSDKKYWLLGITMIILHIVGATGSVLEDFRPLMQALTPLNLLISCAMLLYAHQGEKTKMFYFFILAVFFGFSIEVLGVHSEIIFGSYTYGQSLGFKVFSVPLIIGVNWFLLALTFGSLTMPLQIPWWMKALLASLLMVSMDYLIEPIAILMDYWRWDQNQIPVRNYIGWFGGSMALQIVYYKLRFVKPNPLAMYLFISQLIFFVSLHFFLL